MGRKLAGAIAVCVLVVGLGATGSPASVRPDPGFGKEGKVLLPPRIQLGVGTALLPGGRIVLAGEGQMVALLPSGRIDRGFGDNGFVRFADTLESPYVSITSIAADSRGRLVVAGGYGHRDGALVERYTARGHLDPSFGGGDGIVVTDFGLPAFTENPSGGSPGASIQTFVHSVVVDSSDRIVLAGERAGTTYWFKSHLYGRFETYVGRLTVAGEADRSFSGDGVLTVPDSEEIGTPAVDAGDGLYFSVGNDTLVHLRADGEFDPGFGERGARRVPKRRVDGSIALDGSGNLLLAVGLRGIDQGLGVKRLRPDGSLDRGFGRQGTARPRRSGFGYGVLASDPRGGILVATSSSHAPPRPAGMRLARLRPDGSLDRGFGQRGRVEVPLDRSESGLMTIIVAGSKALLSGFWCQRDDCGAALARIQLGSS